MQPLARFFLITAVLLSGMASASAQVVQLFNGRDLAGWHIDVPAMDKDPSVSSPFIVREGKLVSLGKPNGHIITDADHANYRLTVEYRFAAKPGNS